MTTVIIDTEKKEAKMLIEFLKTISYVQVVEDNQEDNPDYNPEFVEKIKEREKQPSVKLDVDNLWK